jgi:hypothetical protein
MNLRIFKLLRFLILVQMIGVGIVFPYYAFMHQNLLWLRFFAIAAAVLGWVTLVQVWRQNKSALWAVLALVSCKLTIDLFAWCLNLDRTPFLFLGELVNLAVIVLAFRYPMSWDTSITIPQKIFYACVLGLAALIGIWGLFLPENVTRVLPFSVPPLHSRFLGAMYLSGATFMGLNLAARQWYEVRVVTTMIAIWTGMLGVISLFHLEAFNWSRVQVWVWFWAYISYPLIAAWIAWQQRAHNKPADGFSLGAWPRGYLYTQGIGMTLLAISLLVAPGAMSTLWPWKITPLLAQLYGAPFLSYGLGSLYTARQRTWTEVRTVVFATLVFALAVLLSSIYHRGLFSAENLATWLWFGGFSGVSLALGLCAFFPGQRLAVANARSRS